MAEAAGHRIRQRGQRAGRGVQHRHRPATGHDRGTRGTRSCHAGRERQEPRRDAGEAGLLGAAFGALWGTLIGLLFFVPFFGLAFGGAMGALMAKMGKSGAKR